MPTITTQYGSYDTEDPASLAAVYANIKANSTNVPGLGYIPNDRIMSDSRGAWIGGMTPSLPTEDMSSMWGGNGEQNPDDVASAQATLDRLATTQRGVPQRPGIVSRPYPGGRPPVQQSGNFSQQQFQNYGNLLRSLMPVMPNRTGFGPGTFAPAFRPMPRVGQTPMPSRNMPAFPGMLQSPYVQADATGISPQQRGQQGGLSPSLMQYLASLAATFGGQVPASIFGMPPRLQANVPAAPQNPITEAILNSSNGSMTGGDGP